MNYKVRIIIVVLLGNLVEMFDLAICGLLSVYLARYLISETTQGLTILFATFFAGYFARPVGGLVMGLFSDIYGRKITLACSILSMGISTMLIGLIPSQEEIGVVAVFLLVFLRSIQSFSCGSKYLNSSSFLVENAEKNRRGFMGSWASFGAMTGLLVASIVTLFVTYYINQYPENEWIIWRLPFVLALLGSSIGLYIRSFIPESLEYILYYAERPKPKFKTLIEEAVAYITEHKLKACYVLALSALGVSTTFQIFIYGPNQAHIYGHLNDYQIIKANIISLVVLLSFFPLMGRLSDIVKPEKMVTVASVGFLILAQPFFYAISYGDFKVFVLAQCLIAIPASAFYATVPVMLAGMFPLKLRCTVLGILYSTAASISAGVTPLLSLLLIEKTDNALAPAWIMMGLAILLLVISKKYAGGDNRQDVFRNFIR